MKTEYANIKQGVNNPFPTASVNDAAIVAIPNTKVKMVKNNPKPQPE